MSFPAFNRALRATVSLACLAAAVPAYAADNADAETQIVVTGEKGEYSVQEASSAKIDAPLKDIPQTIDVITEAVLRDRRALSLQDALKNIPGVGFSHGDGQRDQVSIRGFTAIADQFIDGLRDDALYFRDLSNVERVEVIKGPASVLYGRGSSGGLINRVSKKPGVNRGELALSFGSWEDYRGEFDFGVAPEDGAAFRLTGAAERSDSFRQQQFLEREAVAPSVLFGKGGSTELLVQASYLHDKRVTDFGIPAYMGLPVDVPLETYYGSANARKDDFSESTVYTGTATLTHEFSESTSLRNAIRIYDYDLDRQNTLANAVNETALTTTLSRSTVDRMEHGWFDQLELSHKVQVGGIGNNILIGAEIGRQVKDSLVHSAGSVATISLFNPVLPTITSDGPLVTDNSGIYDILGVYAQDMISIGDHLKALVGIRFDRYKQKTDDHMSANVDLERVDQEFSPRAGLVWQPTQSQSYYVSWSKSFQPSGENFAISANNADIEPERTTNTEVGAKYSFLDGKLTATLSAFNLRRSGIKTANPSAPSVLIPIGVQRTRGVELSGAVDFDHGWKAIAGYAYLEARIVESANPALVGKTATITPKHSTNFWLTKDFGSRFGFGAGANWLTNRFADPANTTVLPGYFVADAMTWVKLGPVMAQVNVNNIFDRDYIVSGHGSTKHLILPGAPRSAMLTLRYGFNAN